MRVSDEDLTGMDQCVGIFLGDEAIDTWTHVRAELLALRKVADAARLLVDKGGGISLNLKHAAELDAALVEAGR